MIHLHNLEQYKGILFSKIKYILRENSKKDYLKDLINYSIILKKDPKSLDIEIDRILLLIIRECECYKRYPELKKIIPPERSLEDWNLINNINPDILDDIDKYLLKKLNKENVRLLIKYFEPLKNIKSENKDYCPSQITPKQMNYIRDLIDINPNGKTILKEFLESCGKENVENLTKKEGAKLIDLLLSPKMYRFPCGLKGKIYEYKGYGCLFTNTLSPKFEKCIYFCPKRIKISKCKIWKSNPDWDKEYRFVFDSFQDAVQRALNITGDIVEIYEYINDYLKEIDEEFKYLGFYYDAHILEYKGTRYSVDLCKRTIKKEYLGGINGNNK